MIKFAYGHKREQREVLFSWERAPARRGCVSLWSRSGERTKQDSPTRQASLSAEKVLAFCLKTGGTAGTHFAPRPVSDAVLFLLKIFVEIKFLRKRG